MNLTLKIKLRDQIAYFANIKLHFSLFFIHLIIDFNWDIYTRIIHELLIISANDLATLNSCRKDLRGEGRCLTICI